MWPCRSSLCCLRGAHLSLLAEAVAVVLLETLKPDVALPLWRRYRLAAWGTVAATVVAVLHAKGAVLFTAHPVAMILSCGGCMVEVSS